MGHASVAGNGEPLGQLLHPTKVSLGRVVRAEDDGRDPFSGRFRRREKNCGGSGWDFLTGA
jgi:hypothetical protein